MVTGREGGPGVRSIGFGILVGVLLAASRVLFPLVALPCISHVLSAFNANTITCIRDIILCFSVITLLNVRGCNVGIYTVMHSSVIRLSGIMGRLLIVLLISADVIFTICLLSVFLVPAFSRRQALFLVFSIKF